MRLSELLPIVKGSVNLYDRGPAANQSGAIVSIWCCWQGSRRTFKQIDMRCNLNERATHAQAVRALREKIGREHGGAEHLEKAKVERASAGAPDVASPFDRIRAGASAQVRFTHPTPHK